jgi:alkyl sulfatase BDS1-like metallo-beta-lactamase superfamily hydrolase
MEGTEEMDVHAQHSAHPSTEKQNTDARRGLDFADDSDFDDARRGFLGTIDHAEIRGEAGHLVWSQRLYDFLDTPEAPGTVHPGLWRQARLNRQHGLFEVAAGIYQVRGFDLANITFVEGARGVIVIDPLTFEESARAALDLYRRHRGPREVTALLYSHSHRDHYGGAAGVVRLQDVQSGKVPVLAPHGFMEEVVSESVLAGAAMRRRSQFQFGSTLAPGPRSHVDSGLGKAVGRGSSGLIPPTRTIETDGQRMVLDGVEIEFQLTPGAEAPAEMNFFFPGLRALNVAENACHTLHNLCPIRGAKTRDALAWSRYLDDTLDRYAGQVDVVYAQHHWPVWGQSRIRQFLEEQRDLYRYLHDQTLRLMAHGLTSTEIAEQLLLPSGLSRRWHARGYYGTVAQNVQAIYTRYLGSFDGNPANLHPLAPAAAGRKYLDYLGGADAIVARAQQDYDRGEFRWVVQILNHVVFAEPGHRPARELSASAMAQLGYQAESATWRNAYLLGARELREGAPHGRPNGNTVSPDVMAQLPLENLLEYLAMRLCADAIGDLRLRVDWIETETPESQKLTLSNGALSHRIGSHGDQADAVVRYERAVLVRCLASPDDLLNAVATGDIRVEGDRALVNRFLAGLDVFDPGFSVVEP